jgi:hypothetical protein
MSTGIVGPVRTPLTSPTRFIAPKAGDCIIIFLAICFADRICRCGRGSAGIPPLNMIQASTSRMMPMKKQAASDSGISRVDAIPALDQMEERGNADGACCENRKYAAKRNGYGDDVSRR